MSDEMVLDEEAVDFRDLPLPLSTSETLCGLCGNIALCSDPSAEECLIRQEAGERFWALLDGLEERDRRVFMRVVEGMSNEEVAADVGIDVSQVITVRRALVDAIRDALVGDEKTAFLDPAGRLDAFDEGVPTTKQFLLI